MAWHISAYENNAPYYQIDCSACHAPACFDFVCDR